VRLRNALANSYNIPAVWVLSEAGVKNVVATAHRMGITTLNADYYGLALTLGGGEVKLIDMAYAFSVFANGGTMYGVPIAQDRQELGYRELNPTAILRVRLDGGFAAPELFAFIETQGVEYLVKMASNAVLEKLAQPFLQIARQQTARTHRAAQVYARLWYRARTWPHTRPVVCKAEVVIGADGSVRDNPRFVVSNLDELPRRVYRRRYCRRGEVENRIKELKETSTTILVGDNSALLPARI
jgi:hypothetical protein